ncbi:MAG: metallophosphoesterase family protein [Terriglobia bacterium]
MRYLILSDLHAGLEAFEACLRAADGRFDAVVCLGDVVGYGPDPNAVIDLLRRQISPIHAVGAVIRGNHDKACCGIASADDFNLWAKAATYWTRSVLTEEHAGFLRELPLGPKVLPGFEIVHGSERDEDEYVMNASGAIPILQAQQLQLVFFGHTHTQGGFFLGPQSLSRRIGAGSASNSFAGEGRVLSIHLEDETRYLINPGSVGQPRDGNWRAAFAIYDDAGRQVDFYRAAYNLPKTQEKMARVGLPEPLIRRLEIGK